MLVPYAVARVHTKHFSNIALALVYNVGSWGHEPRRGNQNQSCPILLGFNLVK
jgi:hypothetical protein